MTEQNFQKKRINVETLGEYLFAARQSLGFSYEQVRRLTQIPEKYLQALEEGGYAQLPADVYVKGFLKTLSAVYGVPADDLVVQYERERHVDRSIKETPPMARPAASFTQRFTLTPRILTVIFVALAAVLSVGYLIWQIRSVAAPPLLTVMYPEGNMVVSTRNLLVRGATEAGSKVLINGQEVSVDEKGDFQEVVSLSAGTNNLLIRSQNRFGKVSQAERMVMVSGMEQPVAATSTNPELASGLALEVAVGPKPTWIKAVADGTAVQDGIVAAGQHMQFTGQSEIQLSSGDAGSTRVTYNGRDIGLLGNNGEVVSNVRFTAEAR